MAITALSYIGVNSDKFEDWSDYSQKNLGMQLVDRGKGILSFRMDDQKQRLTITGDNGDNLGFMGWEVENKEDLQFFGSKLEENKIDVHQGKNSFADKRFVEDLIYFNDPQGNRIELVYKPMSDTDTFKPGRPISGFKTGALGMGHAVIHVKNIDDLIPFYTEVLGFKISDYTHTPISLCFFHVNGRHHSLALFGSGRTGFHHFMVEYNSLDDVGQGYDLLQYEENKIAYREAQDLLTSLKDSIITLSEIYYDNENPRKAAYFLKRGVKFDPDDYALQLMEGVYEIKSRNIGEGIKNIMAALDSIDASYKPDEVSAQTLVDALEEYAMILKSGEYDRYFSAYKFEPTQKDIDDALAMSEEYKKYVKPEEMVSKEDRKKKSETIYKSFRSEDKEDNEEEEDE